MVRLNDEHEVPANQVRTESTGSTFVGRKREFEELRRGLDDVLAGNGRLFLIAGEPGIGKTRLADELAQAAVGRGVQPIWGRCWEGGGASAYWPWRQVIRTRLRMGNVSPLIAELGSCATDLAIIAPEAQTYIAKDLAAAPLPNDPEQARFRLFDSLSTFLNLAAIGHPLIILLEDLHASDLPSLLLLRFVARSLSDSGILIVGTYRDAELRQAQARAELLGQLASDSSRISLRGLTENEVHDLLKGDLGPSVDSNAVAAIYNATGGNPLFVKELSRLAIVPGGDPSKLAMPNGVRAAIQRHLSPLSTAARQVLSVASVIGREFDCATLQRLSELTVEQVLGAIAEAENARLVSPLPDKIRRWRFSHSLTRDCLYDDIPKGLVARLHCRIGVILEELYKTDPDVSLSEIAHHLLRGAESETDCGKAIYYARAAARHAKDMLAYEEAETLYQLALDVMRQHIQRDHHLRAETLLDLGNVQLQAGAMVNARVTFKAASELALQIGAPEILGKAALGFGLTIQEAHTVDSEAIRMLEQGLAVLRHEDSALKARLLARLAVKSYISQGPKYRSQLIEQAAEIALRLEDDECLLFVLSSKRLAMWEPENVAERLSTVTQALELAEKCGDRQAALDALVMRIVDLAEIGNLDQVRAGISVLTQKAEELRQPYLLWQASTRSACQAIFEGRYDEAERLANHAFMLGQGLGSMDQAYTFFAQLGLIYRDKGRLAEVENAFSSFAERNPDVPVFRATTAYVRAELGRDAEVKREFSYLLGLGFDSLRQRGLDWTVVLVILTELCCYLADQAQAQQLYGLLLPFADRNITYRDIVSFGSGATYLAKLAALARRFEEASVHFEAGLKFNERTGGRPWLAETQYEYAQMLLLRDSGSDRGQAERLLRLASETASAIGSVRLASKIASCKAVHGIGSKAFAVAPSARDSEIAAGRQPRVHYEEPLDATFDFGLRREGDYWVISFRNNLVRIKHLRGFEYIETLIGSPGREFYALNLIGSGEDKSFQESKHSEASSVRIISNSGESLSLVSDLGDAGEMLDANAKKAYRQRLVELNHDLAQAKERADVLRATALEEEIEAISKELRRAVGLMGRSRVAGSVAERARISVTRAIKTALDRVGDYDQEARRFLGRTIRTGTFCCFLPDRNTWSN